MVASRDLADPRAVPTPADAGELAAAAITTIRGLSIDAVEAANSGHPGLPLAMAPAAYLLYARIMTHDTSDPGWPDRDRFVLSAGHGSALLYSVLHLAGYDLPLEELRRFRQWGSATPGHPERGPEAPGVETTTGPLGQGFANGVGMAMAERFLRERYGAEVMDHRVYGICSDGDLMEGVGSEAASLAGHLGLGRIVYIYDDNRITIDGSTDLSFSTEDVEARFRAYGWQTLSVEDANDLSALEGALRSAAEEEERPSLVRVRSVIGWPSPNKAGTAGVHGSPLGAEEARETKLALGLDPEAAFEVPEDALAAFAGARERGEGANRAWRERLAGWHAAEPRAAAEWDAAWAGRPSGDVGSRLPSFEGPKTSTRSAGGKVMQAFADLVPTMIGGSADLVGSTKTEFAEDAGYSRARRRAKRPLGGARARDGRRRQRIGASRRDRPALRVDLPCLLRLHATGNPALGDHGPACRLGLLPRLDRGRRGRADPSADRALRGAAGNSRPNRDPPRRCRRDSAGLAADAGGAGRAVCILLTRQDLPVLDRTELSGAEGLGRGGYVLAEATGTVPEAVLVATGSEVSVALEARELLAASGVDSAVVSMPSWELFESQPEGYRGEVLPEGVPTVSVEAGVPQGWERYADGSVALRRFGASAPAAEVFKRLGITAEAVAAAVRSALEGV